MINDAYKLVKKFQEMARQPIETFPQYLSKERCNIRCKWMREEIKEFEESGTIYEQADAIIDLLYYAIGTLVEMGVEPDQLFLLVHEYNMKKLSDRCYNKDGKVMKPEEWRHPDKEIKEIIDHMMLEQEDIMENIKIEYIEENELVSDIMKQAMKCVGKENNILNLKTSKIDQSKDMGIIISFVISIAADVFIEAVKYVIKRVKNRDNYDDNVKIKINGKIYTLHELEEDEEVIENK